ncbi:MAG TPA: hypothetical protein DDZ82_05400 [Rhodobacteraceae bacterium]|jgi:ketosteroid isomerase-like protein|nr:hypothetical protein [Paracoccaceae bacterium]
MAETILEKHVLDYFRGVDQEDLPLILTTLCQDCLFSVETHGIVLKGHQEISGMFQRLWSEHQWVRHDQFSFVENATNAEIATRFRVTNMLKTGQLVYKSNCNFFTIKDEKFDTVRVYMAGENTLNHADAD